MNDVTLINQGSGIVECRICGLTFLPELEEDRERHEHEHRRILWGGVPYGVREFLKRTGWEAINEGGPASEKRREAGKRAVIFGWWMRAAANGIPENDFDDYMAAQFAYMDARVSGNEEELEKASQVIKRWQRYGG